MFKFSIINVLYVCMITQYKRLKPVELKLLLSLYFLLSFLKIILIVLFAVILPTCFWSQHLFINCTLCVDQFFLPCHDLEVTVQILSRICSSMWVKHIHHVWSVDFFPVTTTRASPAVHGSRINKNRYKPGNNTNLEIYFGGCTMTHDYFGFIFIIRFTILQLKISIVSLCVLYLPQSFCSRALPVKLWFWWQGRIWCTKPGGCVTLTLQHQTPQYDL